MKPGHHSLSSSSSDDSEDGNITSHISSPTASQFEARPRATSRLSLFADFGNSDSDANTPSPTHVVCRKSLRTKSSLSTKPFGDDAKLSKICPNRNAPSSGAENTEYRRKKKSKKGRTNGEVEGIEKMAYFSRDNDQKKAVVGNSDSDANAPSPTPVVCRKSVRIMSSPSTKPFGDDAKPSKICPKRNTPSSGAENMEYRRKKKSRKGRTNGEVEGIEDMTYFSRDNDQKKAVVGNSDSDAGAPSPTPVVCRKSVRTMSSPSTKPFGDDAKPSKICPKRNAHSSGAENTESRIKKKSRKGRTNGEVEAIEKMANFSRDNDQKKAVVGNSDSDANAPSSTPVVCRKSVRIMSSPSTKPFGDDAKPSKICPKRNTPSSGAENMESRIKKKSRKGRTNGEVDAIEKMAYFSRDNDQKKAVIGAWTEENEIGLLRGLVAYTQQKGTNDMRMSLRSISTSLHMDVEESEMLDKVKNLRMEYEEKAKEASDGKKLAFKTAHEQKIYEISRGLWGVEGDKERDYEDQNNLSSSMNDSSGIGEEDANTIAKDDVEEKVLEKRPTLFISERENHSRALFGRMTKNFRTLNSSNVINKLLLSIEPPKGRNLAEIEDEVCGKALVAYINWLDYHVNSTKLALEALRTSKEATF